MMAKVSQGMQILALLGLVQFVVFILGADDAETLARSNYHWDFDDCEPGSCESGIRKANDDPNAKKPVRVECIHSNGHDICTYKFILKGAMNTYNNSKYSIDRNPPNPKRSKCTFQRHSHQPCWRACVSWAWAETTHSDRDPGTQYPRAYSCDTNDNKYCVCSALTDLQGNGTRSLMSFEYGMEHD